MKITTRKAFVGAAAAFIVGLAGPAIAATSTFEDTKGDVDHGVDLQSVTLVNERNVRIVLQHDDLRRSYRSGSSGTVFLDTDPAQQGPEFAFTGGFFEGTDYALARTDGWKLRERAVPSRCSHEMNVDYVGDVTRIRIARACLDHPGKVRVAVKVGGQQPDGDVVRDWLGSRREFTAWVARG